MGCKGSEVRILSPRPIPRWKRRASEPPPRCAGQTRTSSRPGIHAAPMKTDPLHTSRALRGDDPIARLDAPFKRLVDGVMDYGIFLLDSEGKIVSWNAGAERIKGYKPEEIIGRHFSIFYTPEA